MGKNSKDFYVSGKIIDLINKKIFSGKINIRNRKIHEIIKCETNEDQYILPGLIDAHVHIESSMLSPSEFARVAVKHGTVATVSDPHEIANVLGLEGVHFMIENGNKVPFKFYFGAPSCVPATDFETSGAKLAAEDIEYLIRDNKVSYLAEVMNFPGVISRNNEVIRKIKVAKKYNVMIDGHAPGLSGKDLKKYCAEGITTDHECTSIKEAEEKIFSGMKILIREGSAAKNFNTLIPLLKIYPDEIMFCSDDLHPDDLMEGHINKLMLRGLDQGYNLFDLLRAATYNPVMHYNMDVGLLRKDDPADFIVIDSLEQFNVRNTYVNGEEVYGQGKTNIRKVITPRINRFECNPISEEMLKIRDKGTNILVMGARDGELFTSKEIYRAKINNGLATTSVENDILKIVVVNRYKNQQPAVGFVKGFGIRKGAIASSVAHDSHNIIAAGTTDKDIVRVINRIIELKGGIAVTENEKTSALSLDLAGLMTDKDCDYVGGKYKELTRQVQRLGSALSAPFMTLSFMALLVIPELKIGDKGLFDVNKSAFTDLFA